MRILISPSVIRDSEKINKKSLLNLFMNPQNVDIFLNSLQESIFRQGQIKKVAELLHQNIESIRSRESSRKSSTVNNKGINPNNLKKSLNNLKKSLMPPNGAVLYNASKTNKKRKQKNKNNTNPKPKKSKVKTSNNKIKNYKK